jgi:hypothetical protein
LPLDPSDRIEYVGQPDTAAERALVDALFGVIKRKVEITYINRISKCPTYSIIPGAYKSLCVSYSRNGKEDEFKISANLFPESALNDLFKGIKLINPSISISPGSEHF